MCKSMFESQLSVYARRSGELLYRCQNRIKVKKVSSVRAMRNAFITMIVLGTLYYLKIYMSTDANPINATAVERPPSSKVVSPPIVQNGLSLS
jgi:hypothetical protein